MAKGTENKRLGRGLAALIGDIEKPVVPQTAEQAPAAPTDRHVPVDQISTNPNNPRRVFQPQDLEDLANSIAEHGIVQPILVRPRGDNRYEIIAGERRWRAAQKAGLHEVPIIIREVDDRQSLELAIIENVQRADLNPIEEAQGYHQLIDEHNYTQADLAKVIGKSRSHVANTLRLMKLPASVQAMLATNTLTSGHARALITLDDPEPLARRIVEQGLSVRDAERLAAAGDDQSDSATKRKEKPVKDADLKALEKRLGDALGMNVAISDKGNGKGRVSIDFKTLDQMDDLINRLT